ncbi:YdeI/OmpD-associated family protein [Mucilaginibacter mali]|uniref:YdeI/OmpD-associated family protein n=1 Tax=Mucilaginibacter mali TaxID=2740462 RepID=A0A7D4PSC8_9SPHI|nr:YdeI/OmpD-associated family protein [Mucilaginibacter mali]QKJ28968.1 YdeI/OmpD-associated family protein [Mucilaginibacter mali]
MENTEPKVDAYIAKSPAYAQPIITHLRKLIHQVTPQVTEVMKWGHPHFDYKGPFMGLAAFKEHLGLNFWKSTLMDDPAGLFAAAEKGSAGSIGKIRSMADLPADDVLITYMLNAIDLNEKGIKLPPPKKTEEPKELEMPTDLIEAFKSNTGTLQHFEKFSPSAKKEYISWLDEAKSEATRQKRLDTMMEWVAEGKTRHWKYKK